MSNLELPFRDKIDEIKRNFSTDVVLRNLEVSQSVFNWVNRLFCWGCQQKKVNEILIEHLLK